jgi:acid stress chaperone HdeB
MMKTRLLAIALLSAAAAPSGAQAQVVLDVAKITCEQFILYKITSPTNIAMWISGYYNGKRDNTLLDTQALDKAADKVRDYCLSNLNTPVMQAAETALSLKK